MSVRTQVQQVQPQPLRRLLIASFAALALVVAFGAGPARADVLAAPGAGPSISSDQADYAPRSHVILTGTGWQPGETVHIVVNDSAGSTWSHTDDVTADVTGGIRDEFDLPDWFVASYDVTATGSSSASATTSFTDGNVSFQAASPDNASFTSWSVTYRLYSSSGACAGTATPPDQTWTSGQVTVSGVNQSIKFVSASATTPAGRTFVDFTENGNAVTCVNGTGSHTITANFTAGDATPPTVSSIARADGSPTNGSALHWTVTFSEPVTGVDASDFALARTGVSGGSVTGVTGSGSSYTVTASTGTGDGSLGLNLVDDDSILDGAGNKLGGTGVAGAASGDGSFTGEAYAIDKTAPGTSDDVPSGYVNHAVTVTLTASDTGGAGIDKTYYTTDGSTPSTSSSVYDGSSKPVLGDGQTIKYFSTDLAGNVESPVKSATAHVDTTAPSTSDDVPSGWRAADVTVTLTAGDGGQSGVASTSYQVFSGPTAPAKGDGTWLTYDGSHKPTLGDGQRIAYYSVDNAGNAEDVKASDAAMVDTTPPTTTLHGFTTAWQSAALGVTLSADDGGQSGVETTYYAIYQGDTPPAAGDAAFQVYDGSSTLDLHDGDHIAYYSVDNVGNIETVGHSDAARVDTEPPVTSLAGFKSGWQHADFDVTLSAVDKPDGHDSGVSVTRYQVFTGTTVPAKTDTGWQTYSGAVTLHDGERIAYYSDDSATPTPNSEDVQSTGAARVDKQAPTSSASSATYDRSQSMSVSYSAADTGGSGLARVELFVKGPGASDYSSAGTDTSGAASGSFSVPATTEGTYAFRTVATDVAGNAESKTSAGSSTLEDTTAPTIQISTPTDQGSYLKGSSLTAGFTCDDGAGSGVASCTGALTFGSISGQTITPGGALDTGTVGAHTYTVSAADNAGNTGSNVASYTVTYNSNGQFLPPVYNVPSSTVNSVKAGQAVPLKFSLHGNQGLSIFAPTYPSSQGILLASGTSTDSPLATDTAGNSSLSYDATSDTYTYVWKTDKTWAGKARQLVIQLNDGVTYFRANFQFTK